MPFGTLGGGGGGGLFPSPTSKAGNSTSGFQYLNPTDQGFRTQAAERLLGFTDQPRDLQKYLDLAGSPQFTNVDFDRLNRDPQRVQETENQVIANARRPELNFQQGGLAHQRGFGQGVGDRGPTSALQNAMNASQARESSAQNEALTNYRGETDQANIANYLAGMGIQSQVDRNRSEGSFHQSRLAATLADIERQNLIAPLQVLGSLTAPQQFSRSRNNETDPWGRGGFRR